MQQRQSHPRLKVGEYCGAGLERGLDVVPNDKVVAVDDAGVLAGNTATGDGHAEAVVVTEGVSGTDPQWVCRNEDRSDKR